MRNRGWRTFQKVTRKRSFKKIRIPSFIKKHYLKAFLSVIGCSLIVALISFYPKKTGIIEQPSAAEAVYNKALKTVDPSEINSQNIFREIRPDGESNSYYLKLSLDKNLQERMEKLLNQYKPPYAAFVAMDPDTGKILAMASYSKFDTMKINWCLKSSFQAASIFKLVTTAAAVEKMDMGEYTPVAFNGSYYRLKERNVFDKSRRFANSMTLGEAFAKSINIVFAKIAQKGMQPDDLRVYSSQFMFNKPIPFDLPVEESLAQIPDGEYALAKTAAGFGEVSLSPLHGAFIVSAILNNGKSVTPYAVDKLYDSDRVLLYERKPRFSDSMLAEETAQKLKNMMEMTLTKGTIRKTFRGWTRSKILSDLSIGGKTGSLRGKELQGENDWFVGFAEEQGKRIVVSSVIVNHSLWHIKPTYLAKEAFLNYFDDKNKSGRYFLAKAR